jgi:hypothetical protein
MKKADPGGSAEVMHVHNAARLENRDAARRNYDDKGLKRQ